MQKMHFLNTYCSTISDMTTADFPQAPCKFQPSYFLESWLLQTGNHSTPSSRYHSECGRNVCLWIAGGSMDRWKHPPWFLQPWFLGISQRGALTLVLSDPKPQQSSALIPVRCSGETAKFSWVLLAVDAVHSISPVPVTVGKASPSSYNGKS